MDTKAFRSVSYGLYIVGAKGADGNRAGCVVNTFAQVTSIPTQASVAINKENATCAAVRESGRFTVAVLDETATMDLIGTFGFHTSTDTDKFAACESGVDGEGTPYVSEHACSRFSVKVSNTLDVGTHILFIGTVEEAEVLSSETPMTYAFYHQVKGGKTPPKASSYQPDEEAAIPAGDASKRTAWRCTICGHVEYADELPDDFMCPICGAGKSLFERVEL
ncbi:flavin reductase [Curtanaerobium respiraculi]|uniref:flavin reductase n=1 Tax=Curtanaerobium respiraculi TaxID=2949669 RepID=UPI0024B3A9EA|nr:flavin reductase [Curtanaerobium respiraculi]